MATPLTTFDTALVYARARSLVQSEPTSLQYFEDFQKNLSLSGEVTFETDRKWVEFIDAASKAELTKVVNLWDNFLSQLPKSPLEQHWVTIAKEYARARRATEKEMKQLASKLDWVAIDSSAVEGEELTTIQRLRAIEIRCDNISRLISRH
jgi:hypothetical protein